MHKIEFIGSKLELEFPESGLEFNANQFLSFSRLAILMNAKIISFAQFKTRLVYEFLNLKRTVKKKSDHHMPVVENVLKISKLANKYFEAEKKGNETIQVIKMDFYRQLLPKISVNGHVFHGPSDALFNTVYGEFLQLHSLFNDYSSTGDEHVLDRMIATIYRPKKIAYGLRKLLPNYKSDIRKKFNPELTDFYAKKLNGLSPEVKHAIYLFVASCINFLINAEALDIGGGNQINIASLFRPTKSQGKGSGLGMVETLYSIAESKVFGTTEQVAQQNTIDVFAFLVSQKHKIEELQKKQKNAVTGRPNNIRRRTR
ncbi:hypothetical protein L0P88_03965 [Muricauda sp. SCSIO 64092]|uniref:hypothetical protein n=1 Tax=Allomuricauda sp. SCSIO 64092 TaxID=2908842 RepID=UPI001FF5101A|nr:hypothetical protein [Muricauda sp. SCSIO 64092]UOY07710.1 hypothetical protein L0P88_03965 [Muricauda sp. SCSIO 64092]